MCKRSGAFWIAVLAATVACCLAVASADDEPKQTPRPSEPKGAVMAYVNGKAIGMETLYDLLLRARGLEMAQALIADELVRQAAQKAKVTITDADVEAEMVLSLERIFGEVPTGEQRERMLQQFLLRFKVSHAQWLLSMRRNAYVRKLAEPKVTVSEAEIQEEFGRQFGRKVEVRHIQTESLNRAQEVLKKLEAGENFEKLAFQYSTNASGKSGGKLPPIGPKTVGVLPAIRQAALAMRAVGEISDPVRVGTSFHILALVKIIPPQSAKLADVRDALKASLRRRKLMMLRQQILQDLIRSAKVEFVDPVLRSQSQKGSGP